MLDPRYIDDLPASIVALYRQAEDAILQDMARKLGAYDYWMPAVEWQNQKLRQAGELQETIISELAKISKKSEDELRRLMSDAGSLALKLDAEVYDNAGLQVPDFNMAEPLRKVLNAGYQQTAGTMRNLTRSTATAAQQQFFDAADLAWAKIQSGAIDYTTAIREAIKTLADKGIASISYPGGYTDYMDVAVRRAVVTGVNQTACKLSEELADELECDLVEVSAHSGARPSHAEWQGKIYSRSGKSEKYPDFRTSTGYGTGAGLGGWNCRHSFGPYVEGSPRIWSDAELEKLNAKDYEYNGEKLTEYEATQQQRYFERQIRKAKREEIALEAAGQDASEAKSRVAYYQKKQADFLDQTGLKRQYERENVYLKNQSQNVAVREKRVIITKLIETKSNPVHAVDELLTRTYEDLTLDSYKTIKHSITKEERKIIYGKSHFSGYVNSSNARNMNNLLREGKDLPQEYKDIYTTLDAVIRRNTIPQNINVVRYVSNDALESITGVKMPVATLKMSNEEYFERVDAIPSQVKKGHIYVEKGFLSTSGVFDKNVMVNKGIKLNIRVPEGTHGYVTTNYRESEIIFGPNIQLEILDCKVENSGTASCKIILDCIIRGSVNK